VISLCICTYNRSDSLRQTLECIRELRDLEKLSEILIVDNNSADATREVTAAFAAELPIRYVIEKSRGLSHARNRAIGEFQGDILLFTDDDVRLDKNWLSAYALAAAEFSAGEFFGGRILPYWEDGPPRWFKGERLALLDGLLVWYDHGTENRLYAHAEEPPFGASFAVRRSLLERMSQAFRIDLGCRGSSRGRGEETEFLKRCISAEARGVYVGEALCWHKVDRRRLALPALYWYGVESGRAHKIIAGSAKAGSFLKVPVHITRGVLQLCKGRGDRFRQCVINAGIEVGLRDVTAPACEGP
jgi:glucosyl-dolichyl phosphate glucuronosyltransferase